MVVVVAVVVVGVLVAVVVGAAEVVVEVRAVEVVGITVVAVVVVLKAAVVVPELLVVFCALVVGENSVLDIELMDLLQAAVSIVAPPAAIKARNLRRVISF